MLRRFAVVVVTLGATLPVAAVSLAISPLTTPSLLPLTLPCVGAGVGAANVYQEVEVCPPVADEASTAGD